MKDESFDRPGRGRRRRQVRLLAVVLVLLLVGATSLYVIFRGRAASTLTWAPPGYPDYSGYVTVDLAAGGGAVDLDDSKDYHLVPPSTPISGHTDVEGGRNIVTMGGHCHIPDKSHGASAISRRCITFRDDGGETSGRVIHLEGWYADGPDLTEGIDLAVPSAVVQIQNVRIEKIVARGTDDLMDQNEYAGEGSHPDLLQPFGGPGRFGLTSSPAAADISISGCAGIRWRTPRWKTRGISSVGSTQRPSRIWPTDDGKTYYGHSGWGWYKDQTPRLFLDDGTVWHKHHPGSSTATFKGSFRNNEWTDEDPDYEPQIAADSIGTYAYYSDKATNVNGLPAVRNFDDTAFGRIYSGLPPNGDYVPKGGVGIGYVSPGYG
jgi:hypothetical protein